MPSEGGEGPSGWIERAGHLSEVFRMDAETARFGAGSGFLGGAVAWICTLVFGPGVDAGAVVLACLPLGAIAYSLTSDLLEGGNDSWDLLAGAVLWFVLATIVAAVLAYVLGYPFESITDVVDVNGGLPAWLAIASGVVIGLYHGWGRRQAKQRPAA